MRFSVQQWAAWAPGLAGEAQWRAWFDAPCPPADAEASPPVDFLPPMQRRRLSRLARQVFHCAWPLAQDQAPMPMVFLSRHGETPRGYELLETLARDEPLSPTSFSLSVHNAIVGLWSILRQETEEHVSLSSEADLGIAFLEAGALLQEGAPAVLLVIAEEMQPEAYRPWADDVPFPHAVALRLQAGQDWQMSRLAPADGAPAPLPAGCPPVLGLLRHLALRNAGAWHVPGAGPWSWQRLA